MKAIAACAGVICAALFLFGSERGYADQLGASAKREIIDSVMNSFAQHYVYPEKVKELKADIGKRYRAGTYDTIANLDEFVTRLSADMREIAGDRHIRIVLANPKGESSIGDTLTDVQVASRAAENFGFVKAERLDGNVGYLRFDMFDDAVYAGETAVAALNFLSHCDAVILDLRKNGGGYDSMVRLIASYFFRDAVEIGSLYFTENDSLEQSWTYSFVPGRKLYHADLYILTSSATGSGAEAFTYGMKHIGRATVVGENTVGAAHWREYFECPHLGIWIGIPIARPINPVTKSSWEKVGVMPDVPVPAAEALAKAHMLAIENFIAKCSDKDKRLRLNWALTSIEAQSQPLVLTHDQLLEYVGLYDDSAALVIRQGRLCYRYRDGTEYLLYPCTKDVFGFDVSDNDRLRVMRADNGDVAAFQIYRKSGYESKVKQRVGPWIE